jgi:hypothetical protein
MINFYAADIRKKTLTRKRPKPSFLDLGFLFLVLVEITHLRKSPTRLGQVRLNYD